MELKGKKKKRDFSIPDKRKVLFLNQKTVRGFFRIFVILDSVYRRNITTYNLPKLPKALLSPSLTARCAV